MSSRTTSESSELLIDLILINNDRIKGYQTALSNLKIMDTDLERMFTTSITMSHQFRNVLARALVMQGGEIPKGNSIAGRLYKIWMGGHSYVNGYAREAILVNCENGDKVAIAAYESALSDDRLKREEEKDAIDFQYRWLKGNLQRLHNLRKRAESANV